ncbi:MAG: enoyl-CoA hydratase-related protein [Actinomycetota bacterium]|nr:enoyl-CoA hydratase-related protein [Actinomycetota bacterium]
MSDGAPEPGPWPGSGHLRRTVVDGVLRLTIDHEPRLNALTGATMRGLVAALEQAGTDESVRVVVLTGAGRAFCSGADLSDIGGEDADPEAIMAGAELLVRSVVETPVPVVARVHGPAVGIGMSLALAADLAYVGPEAYLLQSFLSIGLMPDGGSTLLLAAAMGRARANEAVLLGRRIPGAEAAEHGLVAGAASTIDELDALVERAVARCVAAPRRAVVLTKEAMLAAALPGLGEALAREGQGQRELLRSADFAERAQALLSRSSARA